MSMDLGVKTFETDPAHFEAGSFPVAKTVATAGEDIPARAPVARNESGKLVLLTVTTTGSGESAKTTVNTQGLYGIVPDSIRKDEEGPVYLTGEFFADSLTLPDGVSAADIAGELRGIGIFLK